MGSGGINRQDIVNGCLRLRGPAQALELSLLVYQVTQMYNDMIENQHLIQETIIAAVNGRASELGASISGIASERGTFAETSLPAEDEDVDDPMLKRNKH